MRRTGSSSDPISQLTLTFQIRDGRPDWPVVRILVDGKDPFRDVAPDWLGFDPEQILGPRSPLLPREPAGRRVAVYRCSCGEAGCGVIAPVIESGRGVVSWVDFRDYTGVFADPVADHADQVEGTPWRLPDLHFDREQYVAEVTRLTGDSSWETARRRTARLVKQRLAPLRLVLPPDLAMAWVSPAWSDEGVTMSFSHFDRGERPAIRQQLLQLRSRHADPAEAADDIVGQLLSTKPTDWVRVFGWNPA